MSNSSALPNPDVYLNHLPPNLAFAWEVSRDIYLVTCGALIWDILSSIPKDLKIFRRFNVGALAYGLCRPTALGYVLTDVITKTSMLPDCHAMVLTTTCLAIIATGTTSFLFLLRVQAVYSHSKLVRYAFFFLWLVQIGLSVLIPMGASSIPLDDTGYCVNGGLKKSTVAATVMPPLFDTLVFGFISHHVVTTHASDSDRWRIFFLGKTLPRLSKAMLQGGQQYYLLTVGMNITAVALVGSSSVPKIYQIIVTIPAIAFASAMACNVHRDLISEVRQGVEQEPGAASGSLGLSFTDMTSVITRSFRSEGSANQTGPIGPQLHSIPELKTWPEADLDCAV